MDRENHWEREGLHRGPPQHQIRLGHALPWYKYWVKESDEQSSNPNSAMYRATPHLHGPHFSSQQTMIIHLAYHAGVVRFVMHITLIDLQALAQWLSDLAKH